MYIEQQSCNTLLRLYLIASYAYYVESDPIMSDHDFDRISVLLLEKYDSFEHEHKNLVTKDDLRAGTLLLLSKDYPEVVYKAYFMFKNRLKTEFGL